MAHSRKESETDLSFLLEKIYAERGWDFRNYKKASLTRRLSKRISALKMSSYKEYCSYLETDPSEYNRLFSNITVKVSEFFREPEVFDYLRGYISSYFPGHDGLKVWCCGCAYGEEAYSLAILMSVCMGPDALKNTKIFATDIDGEALDQARKALYRDESLKNVPPDIKAGYLFNSDGLYKVKYNIRNLVKFGTLDIVKNHSLSGVHILFCRNVFIYFNKHLQEEVFKKLDYALKPGGILVMGRAEVLPPSFSHRYAQLGKKMSIYRKRSN